MYVTTTYECGCAEDMIEALGREGVEVEDYDPEMLNGCRSMTICFQEEWDHEEDELLDIEDKVEPVAEETLPHMIAGYTTEEMENAIQYLTEHGLETESGLESKRDGVR